MFVIIYISCNDDINSGSARLIKYRSIQRNIELIKKECGDLCDMSPSKYNSISKDSKFHYVPIEKKVNCNRLWNTSIFDEN